MPWKAEEGRLAAAKQNTCVRMRGTHVEVTGSRDVEGGGFKNLLSTVQRNRSVENR